MAKGKTSRKTAVAVRRSSAAPVVVVQQPTRRRRAAVVVRRAAGVARRAAKRGASAIASQESELLTVGGAVAFGFAEGTNDAGEQRVPLVSKTIGEVDPALAWGAALVFGPLLLGRLKNTKSVRRLRQAGLGVLAYGAGRAAKRGSINGVAGDDEDD